MSFYKTIKLTEAERAFFDAKAESQEGLILNFFLENSDSAFTPSQIHEQVLPGSPITSVRRAMSDLTKLGHLTKTEEHVKGEHGVPEHCWELRRKKESPHSALTVTDEESLPSITPEARLKELKATPEVREFLQLERNIAYSHLSTYLSVFRDEMESIIGEAMTRIAS